MFWEADGACGFPLGMTAPVAMATAHDGLLAARECAVCVCKGFPRRRRSPAGSHANVFLALERSRKQPVPNSVDGIGGQCVAGVAEKRCPGAKALAARAMATLRGSDSPWEMAQRGLAGPWRTTAARGNRRDGVAGGQELLCDRVGYSRSVGTTAWQAVRAPSRAAGAVLPFLGVDNRAIPSERFLHGPGWRCWTAAWAGGACIGTRTEERSSQTTREAGHGRLAESRCGGVGGPLLLDMANAKREARNAAGAGVGEGFPERAHCNVAGVGWQGRVSSLAVTAGDKCRHTTAAAGWDGPCAVWQPWLIAG